MAKFPAPPGSRGLGAFGNAMASNATMIAALETLDGLIKQATLHTPGGALTADDMHGLYRRVTSIHGCGLGDVAAWDAQRRDHTGKRVHRGT